MRRHQRGGAHGALWPFMALLVMSTMFLASCVVLPAAATGTPQPPYLALGDSIAFGYVAHPPASDGADPYGDAANFVAYPAVAGRALGLDVINAACPGETSGSLIALGAPDNGCSSYRGSHPLHVEYAGKSQLQFAESFLQTHPARQLVTLGIGLNDGLLVSERCGSLGATSCIAARLPAVISSVRSNILTVVRALRATGYQGRILLMDYYSVDYSSARFTTLVSEVNRAIAAVASTAHLPVAGDFAAFEDASVRDGGDACVAGLLQAGVPASSPCDLHPSLTGQRVLAALVERAVTGGG